MVGHSITVEVFVFELEPRNQTSSDDVEGFFVIGEGKIPKG